MASTFIRASQTLYVRNVCEKASKKELKISLYHLFSQHGAVIDVVVMKTEKMRGQAFVVFRDVTGATAALRALQGFPFFERPLKIEYAQSKSNAVALLEGKVAPRKEKTGAAVAAGPTTNGTAESSNKRAREDDNEDAPSNKRATIVEEDDEDDDVDMEQDDDDDEDDVPPANPPSKILYLTSLPSQITADGPEALTTLFKDYKGFKEVRLVPGKPDLAFVEYGTVDQAVEARKRLDGFSIMQGKVLKIQYSKV
ncbi:RNA recognition protein [Rhizoclosmatium globosum]|uniref:RNA recognition protein n=1 Tax=Rhizoclosmatium globosum TaxID=329046 RepID=A0A1Y2C6Z4_9FUNG|nr:hypothetical protein HDU99_000263 [Rhizoclosmatium hyalinum]KAJ3288610.1 hypothetical protein HDU79_004737 [Rhizoclosmatium sp. JEL0117]ORY42800.1 RNA recognition protein [Rhizoclosmatium globosum]|eukprot:ORY42800.1 RNA recognition protein [Rhizoclosmatium globosum]